MHTSKKIYAVTPGEECFRPFMDALPRKLRFPVVYVMQMVGAGYVKIGSTSNIRSRFVAAQTSSPFEITCEYYLCPPEGICHTSVEIAAHSALSDFRAKGEWFRVGVDEAISAIRSAI